MTTQRRADLPAGAWQILKGAVQPSEHPALLPPTFWVVAEDSGTGDRVEAQLSIGEKSGEYTRDEWGLPADLAWERVWYLAHIKPRLARATGGTTAIIRFLAREADAHRVWVTTEVKTIYGTDAIVRALLTKRGGFVSPNADYIDMMVRAPGVRPP